MSKAIFRVSGIETTSDLQGIGKHNLERISRTNPDIDTSKSKDNMTLQNCIRGRVLKMRIYNVKLFAALKMKGLTTLRL